ncbi:hypothetical protein EDC04DRAFT_2890678 [Pisolithus marmoratus]|nr:hypothetical protein EDC04DRAFT_2890678 [Pisolithus marmoratus]
MFAASASLRVVVDPRSYVPIPHGFRDKLAYPEPLPTHYRGIGKTYIILAGRIKDSLVYKDAFDGHEAVDKIIVIAIIKTPDRNLALPLGRALDSQKSSHGTTGELVAANNNNDHNGDGGEKSCAEI